ncbi:MAG: hypothetical protein AAGI44_08365 [Pseudomonadota bacterium]
MFSRAIITLIGSLALALQANAYGKSDQIDCNMGPYDQDPALAAIATTFCNLKDIHVLQDGDVWGKFPLLGQLVKAYRAPEQLCLPYTTKIRRRFYEREPRIERMISIANDERDIHWWEPAKVALPEAVQAVEDLNTAVCAPPQVVCPCLEELDIQDDWTEQPTEFGGLNANCPTGGSVGGGFTIRRWLGPDSLPIGAIEITSTELCEGGTRFTCSVNGVNVREITEEQFMQCL